MNQVKRSRTKRKLNDEKLWKVFSLYIRLKHSDENGFCTCYTCGAIRYFSDLDCGHGVGRQHKATKFDEKNNRPQCKPCNAWGQGKADVFKEKMDLEHGPGTWELMNFKSKQPFSWGQFEVDLLFLFYLKEIRSIIKVKHLARGIPPQVQKLLAVKI